MKPGHRFTHYSRVDMSFFDAPSDLLEQGDAQLSAQVLPEFPQPLQQQKPTPPIPLFEDRMPEGKTEAPEQAGDSAVVRVGQVSGEDRVAGVEGDTDGHRFAVPQIVAAQHLQFMSRPMAEVEGPGIAVFEGIAALNDMLQMQKGAVADQAVQRPGFEAGEDGGIVLDPLVKPAIPDKGDFDGFGKTCPFLPVGERVQERAVDDHPPGRLEGADQVFDPTEVPSCLHADARIVLGQHRGRHPDMPDPAMKGRGGETDQVEDRAATDGQNIGMPVQAKLQKLLVELVDHPGAVLDRLASRNDLNGSRQLEILAAFLKIILNALQDSRICIDNSLVDIDGDTPPARLCIPEQNLRQGSVAGFEDIPGENDRVFDVEGKFLNDGFLASPGNSLNRPIAESSLIQGQTPFTELVFTKNSIAIGGSIDLRKTLKTFHHKAHRGPQRTAKPGKILRIERRSRRIYADKAETRESFIRRYPQLSAFKKGLRGFYFPCALCVLCGQCF